MPELNNLPSDIYSLFNPNEHHECREDNLENFANNLKQIVRTRLSKNESTRGPLRFSSLGKPDRQLWYEAHPDGTKEEMSGKTFYKFLYGAVIEELVLLLAKEAGHDVKDEQRQVERDGVTGSIDARIDGVIVDVKSASPYGFTKFRNNSVYADDPFGYVAQLAGYADELTPGEDAAWLAVDKVSGDICISPLSKSIIAHHKPGPIIEHQKEVISRETEPDRCYSDKEMGKSGNRELVTACSYCPHKHRCYPGLRGFAYSGGPKWLSVVAKLPEVPEIV